LTGRVNKYSIAALSLQGEGINLVDGIYQPSTNYSALRLKRDISKNSHIGLMALSQQTTSSNYSRAFGLDGLWNVNKAVRLDASVARSFSPNAATKEMASDFGFILNKEWIDINLRYTYIDSLFNPKMGFVRRPNIRNADGNVTFTKWINSQHIQNIAVSSGLLYITDHHRVLQTRDNTFLASFLTGKGDEIEIGAIRSYEFVPKESSIRHIKINPGIYSTWTQSVSLSSYRSRPIYANSSFQWGELFDGKHQSANVQGTAKLSKHLLVDVAYAYNHLDLQYGSLTSNVLSTRWTHSFSPDLFAKAYLQWNTADKRFSANFLIDYAYKPRSHIYLVYNENRDTLLHQARDRILLLKITYLWQI
jgi:hypothetical protein